MGRFMVLWPLVAYGILALGCSRPEHNTWDVDLRVDAYAKDSWHVRFVADETTWQGQVRDFPCSQSRFSQQLVLRDHRGTRQGNITVTMDDGAGKLYVNWSLDQEITMRLSCLDELRRELHLRDNGTEVFDVPLEIDG